MGARDREITGGREETIEGGVILRFPGDWVGPLEDLVPFGPSADRESPSTSPDFWGEDSAALQDAVEVADAFEMSAPPARVPRYPRQLGRWLMAVGATLAVALFAVAAALGGGPSAAPHVRAVPFTIPSIPPLAAAPQAAKHRPAHHRMTSHLKRHPRPARSTTVSASPSPTGTSTPVTTPSPTYHPAPASTSSSANSSQTGGAFTLGGP